MSIRDIAKIKIKKDRDLWLYDENINNIIKKFAKTQKDSKYYYS